MTSRAQSLDNEQILIAIFIYICFISISPEKSRFDLQSQCMGNYMLH